MSAVLHKWENVSGSVQQPSKRSNISALNCEVYNVGKPMRWPLRHCLLISRGSAHNINAFETLYTYYNTSCDKAPLPAQPRDCLMAHLQ